MDNLVLLCGQHHRLVHHSNRTVTITDGRPEFGWAAGPMGWQHERPRAA